MSVAPHLASCPNVNHLWAALLVEELVRQGTTLFVVCPGSRSTPLAVAVAHNPRAESVVHWDERAAGFVALGWGRATGRPAAVVTTSGTAVANLLPAATEADADGVPILLITADRPPELRETGANQTVRQPPVFRDVARWALDWPVPTTDVPARWVLSTASHAVHRALETPGPVHLNLPFREPLGAQADGLDPDSYLADVRLWADADGARGASYPAVVTDETRGRTTQPSRSGEPIVEWCALLREMPEARGAVVMGGGLRDERSARDEAIGVAESLGWPFLPDVLAGGGCGGGAALPQVPEYDVALTGHPRSLRPNVVLHVGGRPTSKRLARLIEEARPALYLHIDPRHGRADPGNRVTHRSRADASNALRQIDPEGVDTPPDWIQRWRAAGEAAHRAMSQIVDESGLSEPYVARELTRKRSAGQAIVVAASMPVRDLDAFGHREGRAGPVFANRGASGIDGTIATSHGVARGLRRPVFSLVGDLALLHDLTSLALLAEGPPVVVVAINNDGGGIFHRLPISGDAPGALVPATFERFFGTPHGLRFEHAARQFGVEYHAPTTCQAFDDAIEAARLSAASAVIEVRTNRDEQAALRARIEAAVAAAVEASLAEAGSPAGDEAE